MSTDDIAAKRGLSYCSDFDEAVARIDRGEADAGFFLRPTPVDQVRAVADAGETMPPKSTYFFPKLLTGLAFNPLSAEAAGAVKIYTRKGDDGTTGLWYGGRRPKSDDRIEAYGSIDEAGSALGVARSLCGPDRAEVAADLLDLQRDLFVAGAELAAAPEAAERLEDGVSRITAKMVSEPRTGDRPLHGPGRSAAEVRDPGRHPALRLPRPRAGDPAPRRAPRRRALASRANWPPTPCSPT